MPRHVIILPYFCDEEVRRYLSIADWIAANCERELDCSFLLAASPRTTPNEELLRAFSRLGPCHSLRCPTAVFGYPAGPTAMFWDAMDEVARVFHGDGFALWMESDMVPARTDWIRALSADWDREPERPLLMGCFIPAVYRRRLFKPRKQVLTPHINGGACYALDFARRIPASARQGIFDLAVYEAARTAGPVVATELIGFSTLATIRSDLVGGKRAVLHGYLQDKDRFVAAATRPLSDRERAWTRIHPLSAWWTDCKRKLKIAFVRKGPQITLERAILAQKGIQPGRIPATGS